MVFARDLTRRQAAQVFASDHVRTEGEQRAWLLEKQAADKRRAAAVEASPAWSIVGNKVRFNRVVTLTKRELQNILSQLK